MSHSGRTLLAIAVASGLAGTAQAATLQVCPTCADHTIQGAINKAASGSVIQIAAGLYNENLSVIGKQLTLQRQGATDSVEVRGLGKGPTLVLGSASGTTSLLVTIDGLRFSNGNHPLGSGTAIGGGIQVRQGAYLHLKNSVVHDNSAGLGGGGIGVNTPGGPATTIENSTIANNQAHKGGGVYVAPGSTVSLEGTTVTGNAAVPDVTGAPGGGIYNDSNSTLNLDRATVSNNTATDGAGLYAEVHSHTNIMRSAITENIGFMFCSKIVEGCLQASGIGMFVASDFSIVDSTISHNHGNSDEGLFGGGMLIVPSGTMSIDHSVIGFNDTVADIPPGAGTDEFAGFGGGIFIDARRNGADPAAKIKLSNVFVINNLATNTRVGGIDNPNGGNLVLTNVTIRDNSGTQCSGKGCL